MVKQNQPRPGLTPSYSRPKDNHIAAATEHLAAIEQSAGPGHHFLATALVRALIAKGNTTAAAMWIIHDQIKAGRYKHWSLDAKPKDGRAFWVDGHLPAGVPEAGGRLSVDTVDGCDWGWLGITLPLRGLGIPSKGRQPRTPLSHQMTPIEKRHLKRRGSSFSR